MSEYEDNTEKWWATGIFLSQGEVYTLSVIIDEFVDGNKIHERLLKEDEDWGSKGRVETTLCKVIMTYNVFSPIEWWARHPPEIITVQGERMLWGEGEGISEKSFNKKEL